VPRCTPSSVPCRTARRAGHDAVSIRSVAHHHGERDPLRPSDPVRGFNPLRGSSPRRTFPRVRSSSQGHGFNPLRGSSPRRTPATSCSAIAPNMFQSAPWLITTENVVELREARQIHYWFQSAPWLITTENAPPRAGSRSSASFNPLRGSSPRRTVRVRPVELLAEVSIRSVAHHHGERDRADRGPSAGDVSIRSVAHHHGEP